MREKHPDADDGFIRGEISKKIIDRYAKLSAISGGTTALAGVIPGLGTVVAATGGAVADISVCMKLQIDMTMCLAINQNEHLSNEDAKHMSFIIALSGSLEKVASGTGSKAASKAAVRVVQNTLKGPVLQTIKELFKRVGITFTRKSLEKAIPFGVGVVVGSSANYALTRFVGGVARDVLIADSEAKKDSASVQAQE